MNCFITQNPNNSDISLASVWKSFLYFLRTGLYHNSFLISILIRTSSTNMESSIKNIKNWQKNGGKLSPHLSFQISVEVGNSFNSLASFYSMDNKYKYKLVVL